MLEDAGRGGWWGRRLEALNRLAVLARAYLRGCHAGAQPEAIMTGLRRKSPSADAALTEEDVGDTETLGTWRAGSQGGRGAGFAKARVCSRSCHESKIRKLVIDARLLKNERRGPCFSRAERQSSSAISQVV
jgi:hypothetical protein